MPSLPSNAADLTLTEIAGQGCDYINHQVAAHVFANQAMENIYQGEIEKEGRGSTQEYSDNTTGSSITVIRPLPLPVKARELGAAINGGNFSAFDYQPASDAYTLHIITVIDDIVDIPNVSLDMIPVGVAAMYIKNISDKVVLNMNALKIAAGIFVAFQQENVDEKKANVYTRTAGTLLADLTKTYALLDKGDVEHGVAMFPQDDRIGLISVDTYADVISTNGVFSLGGANFAYGIAREGGISEGAKPRKLADGYVGDLFGIPFHTVAPLVWLTVSEYLGFPEEELEDVLAIIKSAHGNLFGLATGSSIKTIDSPKGQGIRLQPLYRMGAACVMPKSNAILVKSGFKNPYDLKDALTAASITGVDFSYKAPASRQVFTAKLTASSSLGMKLDVVGTVKGNLWVQTDAPVKTVGEFMAAYDANSAVKGSGLTSSATTLTGCTAGKYCNVLVVDADGTCKLDSAVLLGA